MRSDYWFGISVNYYSFLEATKILTEKSYDYQLTPALVNQSNLNLRHDNATATSNYDDTHKIEI